MSDSGYHHGDLPDALVRAALAMVEERGVEGFSLREAARQAGVSSGAPYRHFADKDALLRATATQVARMLNDELAASASAAEDSATRFRAMGIATVRFAVEHPNLFRLLNDPRWVDRDNTQTRSQIEASLASTRAALDSGLSDGLLDGQHDPALALLTAHATAYGLARMLLDGHLPLDELGREGAERIAEAVLNILGAGLIKAAALPGLDPDGQG